MKLIERLSEQSNKNFRSHNAGNFTVSSMTFEDVIEKINEVSLLGFGEINDVTGCDELLDYDVHKKLSDEGFIIITLQHRTSIIWQNYLWLHFPLKGDFCQDSFDLCKNLRNRSLNQNQK